MSIARQLTNAEIMEIVNSHKGAIREVWRYRQAIPAPFRQGRPLHITTKASFAREVVEAIRITGSIKRIQS